LYSKAGLENIMIFPKYQNIENIKNIMIFFIFFDIFQKMKIF